MLLLSQGWYSGSPSVMPIFDIRPDGGVGELRKLINHADFGQPGNTAGGRQESAHAHFIMPAAINGVQTLWACDLGLDLVLVFDSGGAELARFQTPPGYGPRHLAFHPALPRAYVVCELNGAVIELEYGFQDNVLVITSCREVFALPEPDPQSTCAAIRVSPGRRHVLVSNRGVNTDSISVIGLDAEGKLAGLQNTTDAGGHTPRDFQFTPSGSHVFIANQDSDLINVFKWNEEKGTLTPAGEGLAVQRPSSVVFLKSR